MAVSTIRRKTETPEKLVSRFQKKVQNQRTIQRLRKDRWRKKPLSKRQQKLFALKREAFRAEKKKLQYYL